MKIRDGNTFLFSLKFGAQDPKLDKQEKDRRLGFSFVFKFQKQIECFHLLAVSQNMKKGLEWNRLKSGLDWLVLVEACRGELNPWTQWLEPSPPASQGVFQQKTQIRNRTRTKTRAFLQGLQVSSSLVGQTSTRLSHTIFPCKGIHRRVETQRRFQIWGLIHFFFLAKEKGVGI